jgi:hypothetical protein
MNNEEQQQVQVVDEKKEERIDELDIIGGAIVKGIINGFVKIKNIILPPKAN